MTHEQYIERAECAAKHAEVLGAIRNLEKRLYIDNGSPSVQTRLDRMERVVRVLMWMVGVVATGTITLIVNKVGPIVAEIVAR